MKCELCGSEVKIVGDTTMHYEPVEKEIDQIIHKVFNPAGLNTCHTYEELKTVTERIITLFLSLGYVKKSEESEMKTLSLSFIWGIRNKLWAEGSKLLAEGDKLWAEAIIEVYGNIKIEWKNWDREKQNYECHLETGEIFKP